MDGILNINKPAGQTSFSVVARIRKLTRERRVGHAGTLDPAATGVLPVCLGNATRVAEFLMEAHKTYEARVELGITTDTDDAEGRIIRTADPSGITREQVKSALTSFAGEIEQIPPMYSALHHQGRRLYDLARAGTEVERKARPTQVYRIELTDWQPPSFTLQIECGKGTYVRTIAHDLGDTLGCGATLKRLVRLGYGPFRLGASLSMPQFEEAARYGYWAHYLYPIDIPLLEWPAIVVHDATDTLICRGAPVRFPETTPPPDHRCRAYTLTGDFRGILHFELEANTWRPEKVFL